MSKVHILQQKGIGILGGMDEVMAFLSSHEPENHTLSMTKRVRSQSQNIPLRGIHCTLK